MKLSKRNLVIFITFDILVTIAIALLIYNHQYTQYYGYNLLDKIQLKINPNSLENKRKLIGKSYRSNRRYSLRIQEMQQLANVDNEIIFLGDSLTQEGQWEQLLANYTKQPIYNFGIGGDTTDGILYRLEQVIKYQPSKLFLLIGANDFWNEAKTVNEVVVNYRLILTKLQQLNPHTQIYIQSLLPINNQEYPQIRINNQDLMAANQELQKLAQESNYQYIDLYSKFVNDQNQLNPQYTRDGVHLNNQGYLLWSNIIARYIQQ